MPPLTAVRFFEAAARHLSVTLAARELHVTAGAVSQQVRKLEDFLGRRLFERTARGLKLTVAGKEYRDACGEALRLIRRATEKLIEGERRFIRVTCTPSIAAQWLVPRLQRFLEASPQVDVQLHASNRTVDLHREDVHFAIRHGLGHYPGLTSELLIADDLIPVCSPKLIAPRRSASITDIAGDRLLHDEHRGDWRLWLEAANVHDVDADRGIVFIDSNAAIQAAIAGHGFALVRKALVEPEIAARRLLVVKAPRLKTPLAYHLAYRPDMLVDPVLRGFRDWIVRNAVHD